MVMVVVVDGNGGWWRLLSCGSVPTEARPPSLPPAPLLFRRSPDDHHHLEKKVSILKHLVNGALILGIKDSIPEETEPPPTTQKCRLFIPVFYQLGTETRGGFKHVCALPAVPASSTLINPIPKSIKTTFLNLRSPEFSI